MTVSMYLYDAQKEFMNAIDCMDAIRVDTVLDQQPYVLLDICRIYGILTENHSREMLWFIMGHEKTQWFLNQFPLSKLSLVSLAISYEDSNTLKILLKTAFIAYEDEHFTISFDKNKTTPLRLHFDDVPEHFRLNMYVYAGINHEYQTSLAEVEKIKGSNHGPLVERLVLKYQDIVRSKQGIDVRSRGT